ncbi:hypothetical protein D8B26_005359 [Coccidioides posadasii str. Silveira]|uniref:uncharacterized protein n=1 Tax=Coccidioides posadasii (strain RMSCC 757 / Silveira) TaxID=443226 RepID=UPI001BEF3DCD|nr:hypothetical protein D8B26_005359 [Coccidioides posadasii str. Silveira]
MATVTQNVGELEARTVQQILLHLCLILLGSDEPVIHRLRKKETDVISWQESEWKERCSRLNDLSDDDYKGLARTLRKFEPFSVIELTGEKIKNQAMALMAAVRVMAGENTSGMAPTPPKSDEFDVAANIMILCACVGIFAITPLLGNNIYNRTDFKTHAAELSRSPLYRAKEVTAKSIAIELYHIILFLQPRGPSTETRASQNQCLDDNYALIPRKFLKGNNNDMMGLVVYGRSYPSAFIAVSLSLLSQIQNAAISTLRSYPKSAVLPASELLIWLKQNDMDTREPQQILTRMVIDFRRPWDMLEEASQDELLFNTWALWYKESRGEQHWGSIAIEASFPQSDTIQIRSETGGQVSSPAS